MASISLPSTPPDLLFPLIRIVSDLDNNETTHSTYRIFQEIAGKLDSALREAFDKNLKRLCEVMESRISSDQKHLASIATRDHLLNKIRTVYHFAYPPTAEDIAAIPGAAFLPLPKSDRNLLLPPKSTRPDSPDLTPTEPDGELEPKKPGSLAFLNDDKVRPLPGDISSLYCHELLDYRIPMEEVRPFCEAVQAYKALTQSTDFMTSICMIMDIFEIIHETALNSSLPELLQDFFEAIETFEKTDSRIEVLDKFENMNLLLKNLLSIRGKDKYIEGLSKLLTTVITMLKTTHGELWRIPIYAFLFKNSPTERVLTFDVMPLITDNFSLFQEAIVRLKNDIPARSLICKDCVAIGKTSASLKKSTKFSKSSNLRELFEACRYHYRLIFFDQVVDLHAGILNIEKICNSIMQTPYFQLVLDKDKRKDKVINTNVLIPTLEPLASILEEFNKWILQEIRALIQLGNFLDSSETYLKTKRIGGPAKSTKKFYTLAQIKKFMEAKIQELEEEKRLEGKLIEREKGCSCADHVDHFKTLTVLNDLESALLKFNMLMKFPLENMQRIAPFLHTCLVFSNRPTLASKPGVRLKASEYLYFPKFVGVPDRCIHKTDKADSLKTCCDDDILSKENKEDYDGTDGKTESKKPSAAAAGDTPVKSPVKKTKEVELTTSIEELQQFTFNSLMSINLRLTCEKARESLTDSARHFQDFIVLIGRYQSQITGNAAKKDLYATICTIFEKASLSTTCLLMALDLHYIPLKKASDIKERLTHDMEKLTRNLHRLNSDSASPLDLKKLIQIIWSINGADRDCRTIGLCKDWGSEHAFGFSKRTLTSIYLWSNEKNDSPLNEKILGDIQQFIHDVLKLMLSINISINKVEEDPFTQLTLILKPLQLPRSSPVTSKGCALISPDLFSAKQSAILASLEVLKKETATFFEKHATLLEEDRVNNLFLNLWDRLEAEVRRQPFMHSGEAHLNFCSILQLNHFILESVFDICLSINKGHVHHHGHDLMSRLNQIGSTAKKLTATERFFIERGPELNNYLRYAASNHYFSPKNPELVKIVKLMSKAKILGKKALLIPESKGGDKREEGFTKVESELVDYIRLLREEALVDIEMTMKVIKLALNLYSSKTNKTKPAKRR